MTNPTRGELFKLFKLRNRRLGITRSPEFKEALCYCLEELLEVDRRNLTGEQLVNFEHEIMEWYKNFPTMWTHRQINQDTTKLFRSSKHKAWLSTVIRLSNEPEHVSLSIFFGKIPKKSFFILDEV